MGVSIEPTKHAGTVKMIVTHPKIYPHVSDDGSPRAEDFEPDDKTAYLLAWHDNTELLGLFALHAQNMATVEVHTCLLPDARGEKAAMAAQALIKWVWANTTFKRLVTCVPGYNRLALRFALMAGMTRYGINTRSYMKNGKLWDQIMLGLSCPS